MAVTDTEVPRATDDSPASRGRSPGTSFAVLLVVGLLAGVATSYGQGALPSELTSLANSATSWCAVAVAVALLPRTWWASALFAFSAFVLLLLGYELASQIRVGFGMAPATWAFWLVAGALSSPVLGLVAWWARRDRRGVTAAVAVLAGIAIGEGVYGLTVVAATTSAVWWSISIALGALALVWHAARLRSARLSALALLGTAVVAGAFWGFYVYAPVF